MLSSQSQENIASGGSGLLPEGSRQDRALEPNSIIASIIIPMKNEASYIGRCLDSILANDFPRERLEILVVDGRSKDGSLEAVAAKASLVPEIRLLDNPAGIVSTAMNLGIRASRGAYVIRMDAHSEYPSNYIRTCIEELERTGAGSVGGCAITKPGADSIIAEAIAWMTQHPVGVGNAAYRLGRGDRFVDTVPFGTFHRDLFEKIGLYREDLIRNQDYELNTRIRKAGGKIYLSSKTHVVYYNVPTISKFLQQAYNNGAYVAHMWLGNPATFCWRHGAPLLFVTGLLAGLALGTSSNVSQKILLLVLTGYFLLILMASLQLAFRHGLKFLVVLPVLFLFCHLAYGVGTLVGLARYPFVKKARAKNVPPLQEL